MRDTPMENLTPPTPSPAERGSAGYNLLQDDLKSSLIYRGITHTTPLPLGEG